MKKIVVLGAGLVGKDIAKDLAGAFAVTAMDRRRDALERAFAGTPVTAAVADLGTPEAVRRAVAPFDLVVGALPGWLGRMALEAAISAGKDTVDIAFFPEDPFELDALAKERGVTAVVDCGVAPGMSNAILGYHAPRLSRVDSFLCLVGGLPVERRFPFEYKAPFSPADVIEEYTRPARYVENGRLVTREALSDPELLDFPGVGTLEALNTDGLRTLARTHEGIPNMKEKTLRYPGHGRLMQALRAAGFFAKEPVDVGGARVRPLDFTSRLLFPQWALGEGEPEFTVMRVVVEGVGMDGKPVRLVYDLLERTDPATGVSSMSRTTGYAAAAAVHLVAAGRYRRPGVSPPEYLGADEDCFRFLLAYQEARGVRYHLRSEP